jgi:hypothetical protein
MPNRRSPSHHPPNSRPLKHPVRPVEYMRPSIDVFAEELEHPWHGEGEERQIGDCGSVLYGNVLLTGKTSLEDVPLL